MKPIGLKIAARTPFVKMDTDFAKLNPVDLSCRLVDEVLARAIVPTEKIQHVIWGMVVPDPNIYSIAREVVLGSKLSDDVEAYSVSRACATSLQAATNAVSYYNTFPDEESVTLTGGVESFSSIRPVLTKQAAQYFKGLAARGSTGEKLLRALKVPFKRLLPIPPSAKEYSTGLTMGQHCELMVKEFKIERSRQDEFALRSHERAAASRNDFKEQIITVNSISKDTLIRTDSSIDKLAKLRPAFDRELGTITAGNASPFTDGAASIYVISPKMENETKVDSRILDFEYVGVDPKQGLLMGPGKAMLKLLKRHNLKWTDIGYIEIHEAFAGQVLCNVDGMNKSEYRKNQYGVDYDPGKLDETLINPWGSSISYGHPFGATGSRMLAQGTTYLKKKDKKIGLVAACTAGALAGACLIQREK